MDAGRLRLARRVLPIVRAACDAVTRRSRHVAGFSGGVMQVSYLPRD